MTVVIANDYHARTALEQARILCKTRDEALKEDIRALRIGILNIMPKAETYEFNLIHPLGRSIMQIEPVWIRLENHNYSSSNQDHIDKLYCTFEEAIHQQHLDGLILTGAPVEDIPFEEITYWDEIKRILKYAGHNISSTMGICWGGLALAKFLGIPIEVYPKKLFGVFESINLDRQHRITGEIDDRFWCPQSRFAGIADHIMEIEREKGNINLLAYSDKGGYFIFETPDQRFIMHLGHPEYPSRRLIEEALRDLKMNRTDVETPENFDINQPINRWRGHRTEFFSQWIKYIHESTTY